MGLSAGTAWVFEESASPTSEDVAYTDQGNEYDYPRCCFWMNTVTEQMYVLCANDGITATWKEMTLS